LNHNRFGAYSLELTEVVSGAGTTIQVTRPLGLWSASGHDNQTHEWVPLTDAGLAAPVLVNLGGLAALRLSTSTGNCHPSYFRFVPAVGLRLSAATVIFSGRRTPHIKQNTLRPLNLHLISGVRCRGDYEDVHV